MSTRLRLVFAGLAHRLRMACRRASGPAATGTSVEVRSIAAVWGHACDNAGGIWNFCTIFERVARLCLKCRHVSMPAGRGVVRPGRPPPRLPAGRGPFFETPPRWRPQAVKRLAMPFLHYTIKNLYFFLFMETMGRQNTCGCKSLLIYILS